MPVGRDTHRDGSPRIDRSGSGLHYGGSLEGPDLFSQFELEMDDDFRHDDAMRAAHQEDLEDRARRDQYFNEYGDEVDDLGDLVDPQNDTYEEEGTHGLPLAIGAAAKAYGKFRKTPTGKVVEAAAIEKGTEIAGRVADYTKDKMAERKGVPGVGTPEGDDPLA